MNISEKKKRKKIYNYNFFFLTYLFKILFSDFKRFHQYPISSGLKISTLLKSFLFALKIV